MIMKRLLRVCATVLLAAIFATVLRAVPANATASADNFHASNLEFWGGSGNQNRRMDGTDYEICRANDCLYSIKFDWTYQSIDPIVAGDSFSVNYVDATWYEEENNKQYYLIITANTQWTTVRDTGGNEIFQWRSTTDRKLEFKFLEGAAGKTSLSGSLETARNIRSAGSLLSEATPFNVTIGDSDPIVVIASKYGRSNMQDNGQLWLSSSSDTYIQWRLYGSSVPANFLYKAAHDGTLDTAVLPKSQEIHDYTIELAFEETDVTFGSPSFSVPFPWVSDDGEHVSSQIGAISANNYYLPNVTQQNEGESYEEYKARLVAPQWGFYKDATTGKTTFVGKFGDFPGNALDYDTAFSLHSSIHSFEGWKNTYSLPQSREYCQQTIDVLSADSFYDGYLFPYVTIRETSAGGGLSELTATAKFSWVDGDGQNQKTSYTRTMALHPVPESIVSEMGGLQVVLSDQKNHGKITDDASFKLEHQNGSNWEDYGVLQKNSNGNYAITGLTPGDTYRIVEAGYPAHYQENTLKLYSDSGYTTEVENVFVAPDDSGTVLYATNAKQTFTVTFDPGEGQLADQYRTRTVEYGTSTIGIDPEQYVVAPVGKVFDSWAPSFAQSVTEDATYVAQYKDKTTNIRARVVWADADNVDNVRPGSVTVSLYQTINGQTKVYDITKAANSSNSFTVEWPNMQTHAGGTPIEYTARVDSDDGYSYETRNEGGYDVITGTYNPRVIIKVVKDWDDNNDALGARPNDNEVIFHVLADGVDTGESFSLADGQSIKFDAYSSLVNPIKKKNFTVQEETVPGYEALSIVKVSEEYGFITYKVTNQKLVPTPAASDPIKITVTPNEDALGDGEQIAAKITPRNDSYPIPDNTTVNITKDTTDVDFGSIEFTEPGRYEYDIEITGDEYADVGVDTPRIAVTVDVTYDKDSDKLVSTVTYSIDGEPVDPSSIDVIIRHLDPEPIVENIVVKLPTSEEIKDGAIKATITPAEGSPLPEGADGEISVTVNPDGSINLGDIEFTEPGEYDYDIKLDSDEYDIDQNEFTIRVIVELDEATNTLKVTNIVAVDKDGNVMNLSDLKLGIARKPENPDTLDKGSVAARITTVSALAGTGLMFTILRRRRH